MKKCFLDKRFVHSKWFIEGVTVKYALDYFVATSDFYIKQKQSRNTNTNLFDPIQYYDVITDGYSGSYKISEEEKQYFLQQRNILELSK